MGSTGMRGSLISREVIADSIELVAISHLFDGLVCLVGCDKTMPGAAMAIARVDIPSIAFYNGSIAPGTFRGKDVTVQDVFEAIGAYNAKQISAEDLHEIESVASRRRRLRRPVHRQHDVDGARVPRHLARRA